MPLVYVFAASKMEAQPVLVLAAGSGASGQGSSGMIIKHGGDRFAVTLRRACCWNASGMTGPRKPLYTRIAEPEADDDWMPPAGEVQSVSYRQQVFLIETGCSRRTSVHPPMVRTPLGRNTEWPSFLAPGLAKRPTKTSRECSRNSARNAGDISFGGRISEVGFKHEPNR
jgi:hypothetical protein